MKVPRISYLVRIYLKAIKYMVSLALRRPSLRISKAILRYSGIEPAISVALSKDCTDFRIEKVANSSNYRTCSPDFNDRPSANAIGIYQEINAYRFQSAIVNVYSPVYSTQGRLIFPDHLVVQDGRVLTDPAGLYREAPSLYRSLLSTRHFKEGVHVGGAGAFNWFHFILECLPKALLAKKLPGPLLFFPVLVPIECQQIESFREALELIVDGRAIEYLDKTELALVDDLVVFDEITTAPFNMSKGCWPEIADYRQHDNIVLEVISELRRGISPGRPPSHYGPQRLFLVRSNGRRSYNQRELIDIASSFGFVTVSPELLPLNEQAALFKGASLIVGASGAAWVGMIFADHPIAGLSWLPAEYNSFCSYSTLASILGHRLRFIECIPNIQLASTGDAYTATYTVDPSVFEDSLRSLID
jgi:hypothetical protein